MDGDHDFRIERDGQIRKKTSSSRATANSALAIPFLTLLQVVPTALLLLLPTLRSTWHHLTIRILRLSVVGVDWRARLDVVVNRFWVSLLWLMLRVWWLFAGRGQSG